MLNTRSQRISGSCCHEGSNIGRRVGALLYPT